MSSPGSGTSTRRLHEQPIHDAAEQEARYREIEASEPRQALKQAMDEWCAVWFWPTRRGVTAARPDARDLPPAVRRSPPSLIRQVAHDLRFFHWELEFPDVFTPHRSGLRWHSRKSALGNRPTGE